MSIRSALLEVTDQEVPMLIGMAFSSLDPDVPYHAHRSHMVGYELLARSDLHPGRLDRHFALVRKMATVSTCVEVMRWWLQWLRDHRDERLASYADLVCSDCGQHGVIAHCPDRRDRCEPCLVRLIARWSDAN